MNQHRMFEHAINDARDIPQPWGRFKTFVNKPGTRNPRVPLALAYAVYTDREYQDINPREALRVARSLGFDVKALMADEDRAAERRWGR